MSKVMGHEGRGWKGTQDVAKLGTWYVAIAGAIMSMIISPANQQPNFSINF